jgi:ABC-2 type transport system ATP-binding protein
VSDAVIEMKGLTRWFGGRRACADLSLRVPRGSVFAFVGRNGAGKSTAISMLLGLLAPTRGHATLLGHDSRDLPASVRERVGYLAEGHPAYPHLTVADHARLQARHYRRWAPATFERTCADFQIAPAARVGTLSRGQRAGMCLGLTLATDPELLILDDPALGLDPVARRALLEAVVQFTRKKDRTVFFSSHLLSDVERVADYIAVLDAGVLRACCSVETFLRHVRQFALHFEGAPPPLPSFPGLLSTVTVDGEVRLTVVSPDDTIPSQLRSLASSVEELPLSFEDSLLAYIGRRRTTAAPTAGEPATTFGGDA